MSFKINLKVSRLITIIAFLIISVTQINPLSAQPKPKPAPVPDAVAIRHPSADEVKLAEQGLKKLLDNADPAIKEINRKYPGLFAINVPRPVNTAIIPNLAGWFNQKHQDNLKVASEGGEIDILFMGDSITDFWRNADGAFAGKPIQDKYFGDLKIFNFGIAGDTTQGVIYRLQNGEGQGFSPKAIMLMIGTNNTMQNNAAEIAEGIGAVVLELQKDFPEAKILLLAVFPRSTPDDPVRATIAEINNKISKLHDGKKVYYMDIGDNFLDDKGFISTDIMSDALHPTTKGYKIWAEAVNDKLRALMK
jgi:lysophospholipase L1-like esterase